MIMPTVHRVSDVNRASIDVMMRASILDISVRIWDTPRCPATVPASTSRSPGSFELVNLGYHAESAEQQLLAGVFRPSRGTKRCSRSSSFDTRAGRTRSRRPAGTDRQPPD